MATEIRFAFALNGGVSLAIWIGGVVDEVLRLVAAGARAANGETEAAASPYVALCHELEIVPKVDVLAGSSAGGLNAAFLGAAIVHGCPNLDPIKKLWLDHGSFDQLLRRPTDQSLISVLNGDENFLPHIGEAFRLLAACGTGYKEVDPPVTVRLTATSLAGRITTISDGRGEIASIDHRAEFVFHTPDFDFAHESMAVDRLARACRSTASFPGAFEPSMVPVGLYEARHTSGGLFEGVTTSTVSVIDGAVLVNLPAQSAIEAIIQQPSRERIERVLALVVPDPGDPQQEQDAAVPGLNEVLSKSIVGIPRTQSLTDFVHELNEHNLEVRSRRAARAAMLSQFAAVAPAEAWTDFANVAEALFSAYRATRVTMSLDRIRLALPASVPAGSTPSGFTTVSLESIDAGMLPWVPHELALGGSEWCWGGAPAQRLAAVLITWINTIAALSPDDVAHQLYAVKERVSVARLEAERVADGQVGFEHILAVELAHHASSTADAFDRARRRWPADGATNAADDITALNQQLVALAGSLTDFVNLARPTILAPPADRADRTQPAALRGLLNLYDGAAGAAGGLVRLLLCVEVIEATFSGTEPRPDQEIRLIQFTSKGAVTIDDLKRSAPMDKLAGVELAHFGAFLKRSWRANDWMWGRLDAAERLVVLLDTMLDHSLTKEGSLDRHTRAIQAQILREELPTITSSIEADAGFGARVSVEGKAFCAAVRSVVGTAEGPVDLTNVDDAQLEKLLALQLVGSENLGKEVGSNLATLTSLTALATTAGVLYAQGPRLLRGPVRVLGASSSVAWRIGQRRRSHRLRAIEGLLTVVIALMGLTGTLVDAFTNIDLGAFRYFAWAFLVLAPVLAVFAAPWLLVGIGRRAMGRQKPPR